MAKQPKLKTLLEDIFQEQPQVNKFEVVEGVKSFSIVGKSLYNNGNIMEIAKQVSHIAEQAHTHVLGETDDWFDQVSVNKNMQSLKKRVAEFKKAAGEAHQLNQRMTGLYEDMGHILNRYYDITEDSGDMDNDGLNEPDDDEYLDNKDNAIKQAMKKETVNDPDGLAPESPAQDADDMKENLDWDKAPAKDGNNSRDQYADSDGEEMKEVIGDPTGNDPDQEANDNDNPDQEGRAAQKEGTIRLKDIVNGIVGIKSVGTSIKRN